MATDSHDEKDVGLRHDEHVLTSKDLSAEVDEAVAVLKLHHHETPITQEEEDAVVCKTDWKLIPFMAVTVSLQLIDKGLIGASAVFGLLTDFNLATTTIVHGKAVVSTHKYANCSMIFFIGYLVGTYPLSTLAQRYPTAKCAGIYTILWAICLLCTPACKGYHGLLAQRFCLGVLESGVLPAYTFLTAMFYRKQEHGARTPYWYGLAFLGLVIAAFVNNGLLHIKTTTIHNWKILFFFWGGLTFLWGVLCLFMIPDSPATARGFTDRERYVMIERVRDNQDTIKNHHINLQHIREGVLDVKIWLLFLISFTSNLTNALSGLFLPIVIKSLGFSALNTLKIQGGVGALAPIMAILVGFLAGHFKNIRCFLIIGLLCMALTGTSILWGVPHTRLGPSFFALTFTPMTSVAFLLLLSFIPSNSGGSQKKAVSSSIFFVSYCLGNIAGPYAFSVGAPGYEPGFGACSGCLVVSIALTVVYYFLCRRDNARRDALGAEGHIDRAFQDLSDKTNLSFRYAL